MYIEYLLVFVVYLCLTGFQLYQCTDLNNRDHALMKYVLVVNLEVKDNHEEAAIGARLTLDLCQEVCSIHTIYLI